MRYYVVTGASRGIGDAICRILVNPEHTLLCVSRSDNLELRRAALDGGCALHYFRNDLGVTGRIPALMDAVFKRVHTEDAEALFLVNNAGVVGPVGPLDRVPLDEVAMNLQVNLVSVFLLTGEFLRRSNGWNIPRTVLTVSSGAGKHAYDGWSAYCAAKAGVDMMSRSIAMEQSYRENPARILSIAPGVVDTGMQELVRGVAEEDFHKKRKFVDLHEQGQLVDVEEAANGIANVLHSPEIESGSVLDLRDLN
jgi:benzil reductase ((S)-benzoin forming)